MKIELGKVYLTRDAQHVVRVISLIGKWSKKSPVVGELHELKGKKKVPIDGLFQKYEHWALDGRYLPISVKTESVLDLVAEYEE
jgi:hypothetical protein